MNHLKTFGFWSGLSASVFSIIYSIFQIVVLAGLIPAPWDMFSMFLPSLLLAVSFVVLIACVYRYAPENRKIHALVALCFALIYAVLVSIVYFTECAVVIPAILSGQSAKMEVLIPGPNSFMISLDALGYAFMSLSTLYAYPVFSGGRLETWTRRALLANGLLAPVILLALFFPGFMYIGALWMITLPAAVILMTVVFNRMK
jgi:hypothetical protein